MGFSEDLAAGKTKTASHEDVDVLINGSAHTLRFRPAGGMEWAEAVDRSPLRMDVALDRVYGYNLRSAVRHVAPQTGRLLVDGEEVPLRVDPFTEDMDDEAIAARVDEWEDVFAQISGHDAQRITDAVWGLNERRPQLALEAAKKARGDSSKSSTSPSASDSRPAVSGAGNRAARRRTGTTKKAGS
ncbi:hypothetical protein ACIPJ2_16055 [Curtobacterium sp. NPDC090217]|uniref:hypothetical protein n=1 Tax=Curtobacterium sp. NPDC090217 TaxID=3363970 RepID=UPI003803ADB4